MESVISDIDRLPYVTEFNSLKQFNINKLSILIIFFTQIQYNISNADNFGNY